MESREKVPSTKLTVPKARVESPPAKTGGTSWPKPGAQMPRGLARAARSEELSSEHPELVPPVSVHPPLVWMPMANPVVSLRTAEPELPPVVSGV